MKKNPTVLLTFMMLAVLCAGCASEKDEKAKQIDTPYVYPIQPGTEEWGKLDSLDAKIAACKVEPELMTWCGCSTCKPLRPMWRTRLGDPDF